MISGRNDTHHRDEKSSTKKGNYDEKQSVLSLSLYVMSQWSGHGVEGPRFDLDKEEKITQHVSIGEIITQNVEGTTVEADEIDVELDIFNLGAVA